MLWREKLLGPLLIVKVVVFVCMHSCMHMYVYCYFVDLTSTDLYLHGVYQGSLASITYIVSEDHHIIHIQCSSVFVHI